MQLPTYGLIHTPKRLASALFVAAIATASFATVNAATELWTTGGYHVSASDEGAITVRHLDGPPRTFRPEITVFHAENDPNYAIRPIRDQIGINYNVVTWTAIRDSSLDGVIGDARQTLEGDGFDPEILWGTVDGRTTIIYNAMEPFRLTPESVEIRGRTVQWNFPEHDSFTLSASISENPTHGFPTLDYTFEAKQDGWYSIAYTGAPAESPDRTTRILQPYVWNENRFPDRPYLTFSFRLPVPTTLAEWGGATVGVLADPSFIPFQPLPRPENSQFAVSLRNEEGMASPAVFAPAPGGMGSEMRSGDRFDFTAHFFVYTDGLRDSYMAIARDFLGFDDHRQNNVATLNEVLHNIIDYGMSEFALFRDEMKGCSYQTDVPGSVKNVSALNPISLALVTDNETVYHERGYPIMEFLMSREKTLFHRDPTVTTQSPSWLLKGPSATISELSALYILSGRKSPVFLDYAKIRARIPRESDTEGRVNPRLWADMLAVHRASGSRSHMDLSSRLAEQYLADRIDVAPTELRDTYAGGLFFWTAFTNRFAELYEMFQETGDNRFLLAAVDGAMEFSQFTWFLPLIPDEKITVNPGGKAPIYWYMEMKGHNQMYAPEEEIPAWYISEIGLTPESSGTSQGHRAILMANHAPWLLRLSYEIEGERSKFLHDLARAAIVGRYASFPGYHINTERTNIYMNEDFAWRPALDISYNSMHYNHVWPKASMILDYMVAEVEGRSRNAIHFPSLYAEGYAYLKNKVYGHAPGRMYDLENLWLWMPKDLLTEVHPQINYVSARGSNHLVFALTNQSKRDVTTPVTLNPELVGLPSTHELGVIIWDANGTRTWGKLQNGTISVDVPAEGITTLAIEGIRIAPKFQDRIGKGVTLSSNSWSKTEDGRLHTMVLSMGRGLLSAFIYSESTFKDYDYVEFHLDLDGETTVVRDSDYPFEHTISLGEDFQSLKVHMVGYTHDGAAEQTDSLHLTP